MIEQWQAQLALEQQMKSADIGRYAYVPGKGYRIGFWRRLARRLVGWL